MGEKTPALTLEIKQYLATIGRKGGQIGGLSRSPAKLAAVKLNGKKGGRPKKTREEK
jgi:general stress protein YciG